METEKLYYADPFLKEFTATVLDCQPGKYGYLVTLDRTAFYPEGGGQPADHGTLDGAAVTDVHEKNGVIFHNVDRAVEIGKTVSGSIDWARRFDHMQQHSGEHICSGLICGRYGCDNVGFHMGTDIVTIDFNADIPWEELLEIEGRPTSTSTRITPSTFSSTGARSWTLSTTAAKSRWRGMYGLWPSPARTAAPAAAPMCCGAGRWGW